MAVAGRRTTHLRLLLVRHLNERSPPLPIEFVLHDATKPFVVENHRVFVAFVRRHILEQQGALRRLLRAAAAAAAPVTSGAIAVRRVPLA